MKRVTLLQPQKIVIGSRSIEQAALDLAETGSRRTFIVTSPPIVSLLDPFLNILDENSLEVEIYSEIAREPTIEMFYDTLKAAEKMSADAVVGIGGGSPLDVSKIVAALNGSDEKLEEVFGINLLKGRTTRLICLPTTAGTGSEVSPNALLLDSSIQNKKAVISPHLVPDAAYIDPDLTASLPPDITAMTGLDALTHAIEAYANRFAHEAVDHYALESIRLIARSLISAVRNGREDIDARGRMAMASLYAGLCLGPVNTAAVHALAYPLGGEFHVAHGLSNAVLLPHVIEYNMPAQPHRYAAIAGAMGVEATSSDLETAKRGVERLKQLVADSGIPTHLSELGIPREAIPRMAKSAMGVTRLLKNNPRELSEKDAAAIYEAAY